MLWRLHIWFANHSQMDRGCFQVLTIVTDAAMNTGYQFWVDTGLVSWACICLGVELLDCVTILCLTFGGAAELTSKARASLYAYELHIATPGQ